MGPPGPQGPPGVPGTTLVTDSNGVGLGLLGARSVVVRAADGHIVSYYLGAGEHWVVQAGCVMTLVFLPWESNRFRWGQVNTVSSASGVYFTSGDCTGTPYVIADTPVGLQSLFACSVQPKEGGGFEYWRIKQPVNLPAGVTVRSERFGTACTSLAEQTVDRAVMAEPVQPTGIEAPLTFGVESSLPTDAR